MSDIAGLKLGPEGYTGIALLGTASSSMALAPFKDQSWAIWACSPGAYPICAQNRCDAWFESHRWLPTPPGQHLAPGTKPWFSPEYHAFLKSLKAPVLMSAPDASIPTSVRIPFEALTEKYGPYFWTSTIAYMLAMAIDELQPRAAAGEKVSIGLWGIDMSETEEYAYQRPGCQHFIGLAMSLGIHVMLPAESDLMRPPTRYGVGELHPRHIRILARRADAQAQLEQLNAQVNEAQRRILVLQGAISQLDYVLNTWAEDVDPDPRRAVSFSSEFQKPVGFLADWKPEAERDSTGAAVTEPPEAKRA